MDLSALALNVDSKPVVTATNDLDRFSAAAEKAGAAGVKVGAGFGSSAGSIAKLVASVQSINTKLSAVIGLMQKASSAGAAMAVANDNVARSIGNADSHVVAYRQHLEALATSQKAATAAGMAADAHVIAYTQHLAGLSRAQQDANAHVMAYRANLAASSPALEQAGGSVRNYRKSLTEVEDGARKASTAIKFTAQDSLNASRQLADIGVTAASGMSPFLIAIQQGPQLLDILQNKAAVTGQSLGAVFRAAAVEVLAFAAPFLPLIALLALAAAGIAAMTKQANDTSGLKKYTTEMGYTKEEVKKLNAVTVTFGDTAKAVFQGALASAAGALGTNTKSMSKTWDSFLDRVVQATRAALAAVYALFAGTREYLAAIEKGGVTGLGKMLIGQGDPDLLKKTYGKAYADAQKGMDGIVAQARKNAQARQNQMAKDFYDKPSTPKGPKSDAEKFSDIVRNAQAEIEAERTRAAAVGLSAQAAAEAEQRTKLLNQVEKAKIPITDAVRAKVDELAKSYADLKIAADIAAAVEGVSDSLKQQSAAIDDQLSLVGLYGDNLTRARIEAESLAKAIAALPKGETLSPDQYNRVVRDAGAVADDQVNLDRVTRGEKLRKDAEDAAYAMVLERKGLGLTGEAALSYAFVIERLNAAKVAGNALSPQEITNITAAGEAYAAQRHAIDQQAQAMADSREVAKGFMTDLINAAREGGNAFKGLADVAINSLNRIIDKLLDKTLNGFLDNLFKNGSGGLGSLFGGKQTNFVDTGAATRALPNALGGVYGAPQRFADGAAFTNRIINTPTLFRFANGAQLGEMGEAGPEAIMPLKRGPNGSLGVQMHGGGKPSVHMGDYNPTFSFAGAVGLDGVAALVRQGGEATYNQMKRDLQNLFQQLDTDGTFAS